MLLASMSAHSFLLFHSVAELFAIVIGCAIFLIAWNSRGMATNEYLLFVGIGYLAVSAIDLLHLLAFPGLNILGTGRGLSSQLWLAARSVEAVTMLLAPLFFRRRIAPPLLLVIYGGVTAALLGLVFGGFFPNTVSSSGQLTLFKSVSEIVIAALFALAVYPLWQKRDEFDPVIVRLVVASLGLRVASELSLVVYTTPFGAANLIGHLLKIIASYLLYKALVENMLMRPYAMLFKDLKQREEQLATAVGELESFSYAVSHDLRAPLTSVIGFADLLASQNEETTPAQRTEYANHIVRAGQRMAEIIDDLLRLGRLSLQELEVAPVDLSSVAGEVVETLRENDRSRNVDVVIEPGVYASGDRRLMRAALENLVGNAWKFTSHEAQARIEIGLNDDAHALYVRDNGAGFDGTKVASLFTPYRRLHSDKEFAGNGIGLATVQRIVKRHGGVVWAEGEVGKGATFYVRLPELKRRTRA